MEGCSTRGDGVPVAGVGPRKREGLHVTVDCGAGWVAGSAGRDVDDGGSVVDGVDGALGSGSVTPRTDVETVALSDGGMGILVASRRGRATRLAAG